MISVNQKARDLILEFEGLNQPYRWPGGQSGITLGFGYDLAHVTAPQFEGDWGPYLSTEEIAMLRQAIGQSGAAARSLTRRFRHITIERSEASAVFNNTTLPRYVAMTEEAFPGIEQLPEDAQGALVSLIYNRGTAMDGENRREMRAIRDAVARHDLREIARQIRLMKRLWVGKGLNGLLRRRDAEADLVEGCTQG